MTREAAKEMADGLLPVMLQEYGSSISDPKNTWRGHTMDFSFKARGFEIKGKLEVTDTGVVLDVRLPLAARLFEGTIRASIERELDRILSGQT